MSDPSKSERRKRAKSTLIKLLDEDAVSVALAEVFAGDREPTSGEAARLKRLRLRRRDSFYSDLIFALLHQYYPSGKAKSLWQQIIEHKDQLNSNLGRNVGITVAACDYLCNVVGLLEHPVLLPEPSISMIAEVALKDGLTRLYDQSTFLVKLGEELKRFRRYHNPFSVLMLDLDFFKTVNDTHGHPEGDKALRQLSELIVHTIRDIDVASRYGGEEFILLLPRTNEDDAMRLAERLRQAVEEEFAGGLGLTISIGVAVCPTHGSSTDHLVRSADAALYASKERGRNRVTSYTALEQG